MKHIDLFIISIAGLLIFGGVGLIVIGMNIQQHNLKIIGLLVMGLIFPYMYFIPRLYQRFGEQPNLRSENQ